jgi:hypothetical protein
MVGICLGDRAERRAAPKSLFLIHGPTLFLAA